MFSSRKNMTILAIALAVLVSLETSVTYAIPIETNFNKNQNSQDIAPILVNPWTIALGSVIVGAVLTWALTPSPPPPTPVASAFADVSATAGKNIQDPPPVSVFPPLEVAATASAPAIGELGTEARATLVVTNPNPGSGNVGSASIDGSFINPVRDSLGHIAEGGSLNYLAKTDGNFAVLTSGPPTAATLVNTPSIVSPALGVTVHNVGRFDTFTAGSERVSADFAIKIDALSPVAVSGGYTIQADPTSVSIVDVRGIISRADIDVTGRQFTVSENFSQTFNAALDVLNHATFLATGFVEVTPAPEPSTLALLSTGFIGLLGYGWRRKRRA